MQTNVFKLQTEKWYTASECDPYKELPLNVCTSRHKLKNAELRLPKSSLEQ